MPGSLLVEENLRFDARLALYHETERWLAVADLHYGYELSQRAAGALFPAWGMGEIEKRLSDLINDYHPETLLVLGDLIHSSAAAQSFSHWIDTVHYRVPQLVLLRGNHDRGLKSLPLEQQWRIGSHLFHHGDGSVLAEENDIVLSGHIHPREVISDGAGFRKSFPALCRTPKGWVLPAFSPWANGGRTSDYPQITGRWASDLTHVWSFGELSSKNYG